MTPADVTPRPTTEDDDAHDDPDDDARGADDARARVSRENGRGSTGRARGACDARCAMRAMRDATTTTTTTTTTRR